MRPWDNLEEYEPLEHFDHTRRDLPGEQQLEAIPCLEGGRVRKAVVHHVTRMLACRTPKLGLHLFGCRTCSTIKVVPHSCKSVFCSSCGQGAYRPVV
jgi:hypothetical protein